jgi:hypothetical protein
MEIPMPSITIRQQNNCAYSLTDVMFGHWDGVRSHAPDWRNLGTILPNMASSPQTFDLLGRGVFADKWRLTFQFQNHPYASTGGWFMNGWKVCTASLLDVFLTQVWEINGLTMNPSSYIRNMGQWEKQRGMWLMNMEGPGGGCTNVIAPAPGGMATISQ